MQNREEHPLHNAEQRVFLQELIGLQLALHSIAVLVVVVVHIAVLEEVLGSNALEKAVVLVVVVCFFSAVVRHRNQKNCQRIW